MGTKYVKDEDDEYEDEEDLFVYEEEKYAEASSSSQLKNTEIGKFLKDQDSENDKGDNESREDDYEEAYLDELL
jgi:hypothetical protein